MLMMLNWIFSGVYITRTHSCRYTNYKYSVWWWHLSSPTLVHISVIMVTMLMIRAIYFKWVIISGRLYLVMVMRALTDILPSGNGWWWWATEACCYSALSFSPRVSPPHCRFTFLSFGSIFKSQVRSSQVLPFRRALMCLEILREDVGNVLVTQSLRCVFLLNYKEFMLVILSGSSLSGKLLFCAFKIRCSSWISVSLGS